MPFPIVLQKKKQKKIDWDNQKSDRNHWTLETKYKIDIIFIYQSADAYLNNVAERQKSSLSQNQHESKLKLKNIVELVDLIIIYLFIFSREIFCGDTLSAVGDTQCIHCTDRGIRSMIGEE